MRMTKHNGVAPAPPLLRKLAPKLGVRELAKRAKVNPGYVSNIFNRRQRKSGKRFWPSREVARRLARVLAMRPGQLYEALR